VAFARGDRIVFPRRLWPRRLWYTSLVSVGHTDGAWSVVAT